MNINYPINHRYIIDNHVDSNSDAKRWNCLEVPGQSCEFCQLIVVPEAFFQGMLRWTVDEVVASTTYERKIDMAMDQYLWKYNF